MNVELLRKPDERRRQAAAKVRGLMGELPLIAVWGAGNLVGKQRNLP